MYFCTRLKYSSQCKRVNPDCLYCLWIMHCTDNHAGGRYVSRRESRRVVRRCIGDPAGAPIQLLTASAQTNAMLLIRHWCALCPRILARIQRAHLGAYLGAYLQEHIWDSFCENSTFWVALMLGIHEYIQEHTFCTALCF